MTLLEKQQIYAYNIAQLIFFAYRNGFKFTLGEATRPQSQILLNFYGYNVVVEGTGLKLVKVAPTSKTLQSRHADRLAEDFNIFKDGRMLFPPGQNKEDRLKDLQACQIIGDYWMTLNTDNVWGADWNRNHSVLDETFYDPYHFEMKP